MNELVLDGLRTRPLSSYLSALGVLRLVSNQKDPTARGAWRKDRFVLQTRLDRAELRDFFLNDYQPTPIVAPWNGGSGFYPKDSTTAIDAIATSDAPRFADYRLTIEAAQAALGELGITQKVEKQDKQRLIEACRGSLPDSALPWIDAAVVLSFDRTRFPPLLGTGGNDGRLEFTNNFMQRVTSIIDPHQGAPLADSALIDECLWGEVHGGLTKNSIGQFAPGSAGGANASRGFDGNSVVNPWSFVLMLEGAVMFAGAVSRRQSRTPMGVASFPFTVRQVGGGYGTASAADESDARGEIWLPLWSRHAAVEELATIFAEARVTVARRAAESGVDFARAIASLGVDRGIDSFDRIGLQVRNGLAYFATPLGRLDVGESKSVNLLDAIDPWLTRLFRAARGDTTPGRIARTTRNLERSILALCQRSDAERSLAVFRNLGQCQRALSESLRWTTDKSRPLAPLAALAPDWLAAVGTSPELRLAMAIASIGTDPSGQGRRSETKMPQLRWYLEPVAATRSGLASWRGVEAQRDATWSRAGLVDNLISVMQRRLLSAVARGDDTYRDAASNPASLADIIAFGAGDAVDDGLIDDLIWSCSLLDWSKAPRVESAPAAAATADASYALFGLCFPGAQHLAPSTTIPLRPQIYRLLAAGRGHRACEAAARRLRSSGLAPATHRLSLAPNRARRLAASLVIPIGHRDAAALLTLLRPEDASAPTFAATTSAHSTHSSASNSPAS